MAGGALGGCATAPQKPLGVPIDLHRLNQAHYVQVIYTQKQSAKVTYLKKLPSPGTAPAPMACRYANTRHQRWNRGAWIWKTHALLGHPRFAAAFLDKAHRLGLDRLYLYLEGPLDIYRPLLHEAHASGMRIYALTGDPSDVENPSVVYTTIDKVEGYNRSHQLGFSGIQFDIEPYALSAFANHEQAIYERYVHLLRSIRSDIKGRLEWGVVVPFWFDQVQLHHESLIKLIMQQADNVAVMAYRTHYQNIVELANNSLCEGEALGKSVYLGIETSPIPDETHFILSTQQVLHYISYYQGRPYLNHRISSARPLIAHYTVSGSEISFYPDVEAAVRVTAKCPKYDSFAGWIINGLDEGWHVGKMH